MVINTAIIQHRRGSLDDFNPEKLTPGELAVITDERSVYMGFPGGEAEKIVLEKDFTSESIKEKLGYEPADEERVDQLFGENAGLKGDLVNVKIVNRSHIDSSIEINDSTMAPIIGITLYGDSIQNGIPSPLNNVPIVNVSDKGNININISNSDESHTISIPLSEPLRRSGNVKDTLEYRADGTGKLIRRIFSKVYRGTGEYWSKRNDLTNVSAFVLGSYKKGLLKTNCDVMSSHFIGVSNTNSDAGKVRVIDADQYGIQFNVDKSMCSNVEEWKAWLSQNNVTVYAELNEPIITELTAEQVSEFCKLHTYDGSTNINTDDICDICVEYISNTKKYIDNKEFKRDVLFFDDFESFNSNIWKSCELPYYYGAFDNYFKVTNNNLYVENSVLCLRCCKDDNGKYVAPYITTADTFAFKKGKLSARLKFGGYDATRLSEGGGLWTFGQGGDWLNPFEFDIIELIFNKMPQYTVHYKYNGNDVERAVTVNVDVTKWHEYSLEITDSYINYSIDGNLINRYRISDFNADGDIKAQDIRLIVKRNSNSIEENFSLYIDWIKVESEEYSPIQRIYHDDVTLNVNDIYVVEPSFEPVVTSNVAFTMESSNSDVVSVQKYENNVEFSFVANKIKALKRGNSTITLKSSNGIICSKFNVTVI